MLLITQALYTCIFLLAFWTELSAPRTKKMGGSWSKLALVLTHQFDSFWLVNDDGCLTSTDVSCTGGCENLWGPSRVIAVMLRSTNTNNSSPFAPFHRGPPTHKIGTRKMAVNPSNSHRKCLPWRLQHFTGRHYKGTYAATLSEWWEPHCDYPLSFFMCPLSNTHYSVTKWTTMRNIYYWRKSFSNFQWVPTGLESVFPVVSFCRKHENDCPKYPTRLTLLQQGKFHD